MINRARWAALDIEDNLNWGHNQMSIFKQRQNQLGDGPVQREYLEKMRALAGGIDQLFNGKAKGDEKKTGFILMVFPFGEHTDGHRCNYMSNAQREQVVTLLEEQLAHFRAEAQREQEAAYALHKEPNPFNMPPGEDDVLFRR